ncbi:UTRA domain-containing protein [Actinosynnema mirum]|nr:UTRA domain-containing protein [Actinosynnema mirum]
MKRLDVERYAKSQWKFDDLTDEVRQVEADAETAEALGLETGATVYERARLVRDGETPTHTLTSYYNPVHVEGTPLVSPKPGPGGGFAVLTLQGFEPDHMTESVHSRMPRPEEVEELELPAGEPVMILTRRTFTKDRTPIEFARGVHAASRFVWSYSFQIPE